MRKWMTGALALAAVVGVESGGGTGARAAESPFDGVLAWQGIGPSRGGRVTAVTGVPGDDRTYYMGACGGGVWKTTDGGNRWQPISDDTFGTGSVGAVAVAPSDPERVYVGMGERDPRGNFAHGDGMYRSDDGGASWSRIGLETTRQIARIVVDPDDPDRLFVAVLGHVYGPNPERGIFRSTDGGATWDHVHFLNDDTGAISLVMHPEDPDTLFAAYWQVRRTPWSLESGGEHSGIYRTRDGGETWTKLGGGLPEGITGKAGLSISAANPDLMWAMVEAEEGGLFRSRDGGTRWTRVNDDAALRQRAWYYTHVYADPVDPDTVYVLNVGLWRSTDGGESFQWIRAPHVDHHDLWINPDDPRNMINGNDGGANVTYDGGRSWSAQDNQPTAQFYHVTVDSRYPYRVYGAQQDNSTASVSSRSWEYTMRDLYAVGGGESGYIAVRPDNPDIVYAGSYGGYLTRYDHATGLTRNIMVWPENPMGAGVDTMKERFQWTFPIVLSPHDPDVLYVCGNRVYRTTNEGRSWETISPDLTTNDPALMQSSGGPITQDNTSVEYYCTIFAFAESPIEPGVLWAGSDDGLVHVSRDGGDTWENVTPAMKSLSTISQIDVSRHVEGRAYLAVYRYKHDDFTPYIYRTDDYGDSWTRIDDGLDDEAFVRSVREDPVDPDLLYAGTETGMYVSFDRGATWESLQLNLPRVPITDLVVTGNDLVAATQGRSFQVLRGLDLLRQWDPAVLDEAVTLFTPPFAEHGFNEPIRVWYALGDDVDDAITIEIVDRAGDVVAAWSTDADAAADDDDVARAPSEPGVHEVRWNTRYPDAVEVPGAVMWGGGTRGPRAAPDTFFVRLWHGDVRHDRDATLRMDLRRDADLEDYAAQFELLIDIRDHLSDAHRAVNTLRAARDQLDVMQARLRTLEATHDGAAAVIERGDALRTALTAVEEELIQSRSRSPQDPLNFPIRLNDKLASLSGVVAQAGGRPTEQSYAVFDDLVARLAPPLDALRGLLADDVPAYNDAVADLRLPAVWIDDSE